MADKKESHSAGENHDPKEPVNLRRIYPIALRSIIRRSLHWILAFVALVIVITAADHLRPGTGVMAEQVFFVLASTILIVGLIFLAGKLLYEIIYFHIYYYGIELEHFVISRGVFFKTRASFPLARLADVYVDRDPIDMIFFLQNVRITTPSPVAEHGAVEGLGNKNATALQNYLLALVNTTVTPVDESQADDTLRALKATEDASITGPSPAKVDPPRMKPQQLPSDQPRSAPQSAEPDHNAQQKEQRQPTQESDSAPRKSRGAERWKDRRNAIRQMGSRLMPRQKTETHHKSPSRWSNRWRNSSNARREETVIAAQPEVLLDELDRAQADIEKSRRELNKAEHVIEKAKEIIEHSQ